MVTNTNTGVVFENQLIVDRDYLTRYIGGKNVLVTQGGGQRGIFTAGVLDAFISSNFDPFHEFYGTSAGALNLLPYFCRQPGLGKSFIADLTTDAQFFSLFGYIRRKQWMNLSWALDSILANPYQLNIDFGRRILGHRPALAAVTSKQTFKDGYFPLLGQEWRDVMMASCAIPTLTPNNVMMDGMEYLDGGISASIPVQEAWRRGGRCIVVIRTESLTDIEEPPLPIRSGQLLDGGSDWFSLALKRLHEQWQKKWVHWTDDWNEFLREKLSPRELLERVDSQEIPHILNGGRWLFGAENLYRLSYMLGDSFDVSLADMLMVHYQTYALTLDFLAQPPDDCFIVQIAPSTPLKSSSLLSRRDDLLEDYAVGLKAGYQFVHLFNQTQALRSANKIMR